MELLVGVLNDLHEKLFLGMLSLQEVIQEGAIEAQALYNPASVTDHLFCHLPVTAQTMSVTLGEGLQKAVNTRK